MNFINATTYSYAKEIIKEIINDGIITVSPLYRATGMRLAEDVKFSADLPSFDRSVVDGYAVRSRDTFGATESVPAMLNFVGAAVMGQPTSMCINAGEAYKISTGAMLPNGADAVVMFENTDTLGNLICIQKSVSLGENITFKGDDGKIGNTAIPKGTLITPYVVAVAAATGLSAVTVFKPLKFAVISTGDELITDASSISEGKIYDANGTLLSSLAVAAGHSVVGITTVKDDLTALSNTIETALTDADIVLISGGSSVGAKDFTETAMEKYGLRIRGVAIKPGKPTLAAMANGKPIFGLPGHPAAAAIVFKALILKAIDEKRGGFVAKKTAIAGINFPSSPGKTTFQPVAFRSGEAFPVLGKSGLLSSFFKADALAVLPDNAEGVYKGQTIEITDLL
ncbi:MAG: molybdopterin molybdotransferase MoeA [Clostridiaceae bacterium]|jgi:molybdopterin molybdotransferase|nr:molybdopterin molybdotransferase MoeA [Clostridiaceae bacterium]